MKISPASLRSLDPHLARRLVLATLKHRLRTNPLQWIKLADDRIVPLIPTPKQVEALAACQSPKIFGFFGGNRAGKSVFALFRVCSIALGVPWQHWALLPPDPARWKLGPPRKIWCVTITYDKSRDGQQEFLWNRIPRKLWADSWWKPKRGFHGNVATLTNGTTFYFKSAEQDLRTFETVAIDHCWIDETIPQAYFQAILPRLVDRRGQLTWTTIPDDPFIDDLFIQRQLDPSARDIISERDIASVWGEMRDNPHIDRREIEILERAYDPAEREVRIFGRFAYRRGLVYGDYDEALHLEQIDAPLPLEHWANRVEIVDPGWENPCAVLFGYLDNTLGRHVYDEIYERRRTVAEIAALIYLKRWTWRGLMTPAEILDYEQLTGLAKEAAPAATTGELLERNRTIAAIVNAWRSTKGDLPPKLVLCDEYGDSHTQAGAVSFIQQLAEFGIQAAAASNRDKDAQRQAVRALIRPTAGVVALHVAPRCQWLRYELKHHRYADPDEVTKQYAGDRERVLATNNHLLACLEYWATQETRYTPLAAEPVPRASALGRERERLAKVRGPKDWKRRG